MLDSIWAAVQLCAATRIGHGVRIIDDVSLGSDGGATLGRLAGYLRDWQIPFEFCPSSNVQTGAVASIADHPLRRLDDLGFRVTVNSDNQLMSGTTLSREFSLLCDAFDWGLDDVRRLTVNAASVAFVGWDERQRLIDDVINPAFDATVAAERGPDLNRPPADRPAAAPV